MKTSKTLVVDLQGFPHGIVSWQRAINLIYENKAFLIEGYTIEGRETPGEPLLIHTPSFAVPKPAIIGLINHYPTSKGKVRLSKYAVFQRDDFTCQYTGEKVSLATGNIDHVIPKSRGGKTTWENVVLCSKYINTIKGNRTPEEAGLRLRKKPSKPSYQRILLAKIKHSMNPVWIRYINSNGW